MTGAAPRPHLPEPLKLRRHLESATVAELEEFRRFWLPHDDEPLARDALAERLQRVMSDENAVYAKVGHLSEKVRAVLFALLRSAHHVADLQGLFRGIDGLEMEYYEAEAALTALARRGFVRVGRARDWFHLGRNTYAIPVETAAVMRGLAGSDRRRLEQIFLRASFRPSGVDAAAQRLPAPVPDSPTAALETL
ncbi:MAG: hypothetical protein ACREID_06830, partial [Planctomycetota bacterium]